jgi:hypothetical protein
MISAWLIASRTALFAFAISLGSFAATTSLSEPAAGLLVKFVVPNFDGEQGSADIWVAAQCRRLALRRRWFVQFPID